MNVAVRLIKKAFLSAIIALFIPAAMQAILITSSVWCDQKTGHTVLMLGDLHFSDKQSNWQKYAVLNELLVCKNAHVIIEDPTDFHKKWYSMTMPFDIQVLGGLCALYRPFDIECTNVDFRPIYTSEALVGALYSRRLMQDYHKLLAYDNEFNDHRKRVLELFEKNAIPRLKAYAKYPVPIGIINGINKLGRKVGLSGLYDFSIVYYEDGIYKMDWDICGGHFVDCHVLQQFCEDKKAGKLSIVMVGDDHCKNIEKELERKGYECLFSENRETRDAIKNNWTGEILASGMLMVDIHNAFAHVPAHWKSGSIEEALHALADKQKEYLLSVLQSADTWLEKEQYTIEDLPPISKYPSKGVLQLQKVLVSTQEKAKAIAKPFVAIKSSVYNILGIG